MKLKKNGFNHKQNNFIKGNENLPCTGERIKAELFECCDATDIGDAFRLAVWATAVDFGFRWRCPEFFAVLCTILPLAVLLDNSATWTFGTANVGFGAIWVLFVTSDSSAVVVWFFFFFDLKKMSYYLVSLTNFYAFTLTGVWFFVDNSLELLGWQQWLVFFVEV